MHDTVVRQCPGWWPSLVRAECSCGWVGPTRDCHDERQYRLSKIDGPQHEQSPDD